MTQYTAVKKRNYYNSVMAVDVSAWREKLLIFCFPCAQGQENEERSMGLVYLRVNF